MDDLKVLSWVMWVLFTPPSCMWLWEHWRIVLHHSYNGFVFLPGWLHFFTSITITAAIETITHHSHSDSYGAGKERKRFWSSFTNFRQTRTVTNDKFAAIKRHNQIPAVYLSSVLPTLYQVTLIFVGPDWVLNRLTSIARCTHWHWRS